MNTQPPLLPETPFKPLTEAKLDRMIDRALAQPQLAPQATVINFQTFRQKLAFTGTMAAMAASILLTFILTPQEGSSPAASLLGASAVAADVSDLILLDSLES